MKQKIAIITLLGMSLLQMIGYATGSKELRGIGLVSMVSPLPFVFSSYKGLETFSLNFSVEWMNQANQTFYSIINSKEYSKVNGPYNIRNVYGAVLSYGAKFKSANEIKLMNSILEFGMCHNGPLSVDLNMPQFKSGTITIHSNAQNNLDFEYKIKVNCNENI